MDRIQKEKIDEMEHQDKQTEWQGRYLQVVVDRGWEYVERVGITGIVCIVPVTAEGRVVLVEQHRPPLGARVIELPAGLVGDEPGHEQENMESAARRELLEETGFSADTFEYLFEGAVSAGLSNERLAYFLAPEARRVGPGGGDGTEDITVHEVPLAEIPQWLDQQREAGKVVDVKTETVLSFWLRPTPLVPGR
jgi:ADP-ribose pyrophosphatase